MRSLAQSAAILALAASCGPGDGLDTKLSTELTNARFVVALWPPEIGSNTPSTTPPAHTKCGMRLRDQTTGTFYTLAQSEKEQPQDVKGDPATWPEHGDYVVQKEDQASRPSHRVRIQCGSLKVLGVIAAK